MYKLLIIILIIALLFVRTGRRRVARNWTIGSVLFLIVLAVVFFVLRFSLIAILCMFLVVVLLLFKKLQDFMK